jgi:hypothetical protein
MVSVVLEYLKEVPAWMASTAGLVAAISGRKGINAWKEKISYERNTGIVDEFHQTVSDFILQSDAIVQEIISLNLAIESSEEVFKKHGNLDELVIGSGLQLFIETRGERHRSQLQAGLTSLPRKRFINQRIVMWLIVRLL